jgi:predicted RNase H-like HicB family nuclease
LEFDGEDYMSTISNMKKNPIKDINLSMPVKIFQQDGVYIAYAPLLDISTYGDSVEDAQKNFSELVNTFLASIEDERELAQILESLGWSKQQTKWQPPIVKETSFNIPASLMGV